MLASNGWIQRCSRCKLPTSCRVVYIQYDCTLYRCKDCRPHSVRVTPHLFFSTDRPNTKSSELIINI